MLERIFEKFPYDPTFYIVTTNDIYSQLETYVSSQHLYKIRIILIDPHKLGPAYTLYKALDSLPENTNTFLSYTDITWAWDIESFDTMYSSHASIACHTGYHPHLVNNNFSAFCLPQSQSVQSHSCSPKLERIREKQSFTDDWMNEYLSIGLFQFSSLSLIKELLHEMINIDDKKAAGEYFPSLLFNYIARLCPVELVFVDSFVHYGEPISYCDFTKHAFDLHKLSLIEKSFFQDCFSYPSIVFASGTGSRMKTVSNLSKADIPVGKMSMLDHVYHSLPIHPSNSTLISNSDQTLLSDASKLCNSFIIPPTKSQLDSLLEASQVLYSLSNFFLCSCDCFADFDHKRLDSLIASSDPDLVLFGFNPSLLQNKLSKGTMSFLKPSTIPSNLYM